ncbi:unnamed protein product [Eretmochelys imbricata]
MRIVSCSSPFANLPENNLVGVCVGFLGWGWEGERASEPEREMYTYEQTSVEATTNTPALEGRERRHHCYFPISPPFLRPFCLSFLLAAGERQAADRLHHFFAPAAAAAGRAGAGGEFRDCSEAALETWRISASEEAKNPQAASAPSPGSLGGCCQAKEQERSGQRTNGAAAFSLISSPSSPCCISLQGFSPCSRCC